MKEYNKGCGKRNALALARGDEFSRDRQKSQQEESECGKKKKKVRDGDDGETRALLALEEMEGEGGGKQVKRMRGRESWGAGG